MMVKKIKKTVLQTACDRKDIKLIKNLIKVGVNIDETNYCGETALDIACRHNNIEVITILLDAGAKIKLRNYEQLISYLYSKEEMGNQTISSLFSQVALDPILTNNMGDTFLHVACRNNDINTVKKLIISNKVLNIQNRVGDTSLHIACRNNDAQIVRLLLSAGCKINVQNNVGTTPLHIAFFNQNYPIAKMLIEAGARFNLKDDFDRTAFDFNISRYSQPLQILKSNILNLKYLCESHKYKAIEAFIKTNVLNIYKVLALKFILSSDAKTSLINTTKKNTLIKNIIHSTNALDALKWAIYNDDFKVFHVILRSDNITLYDLTAHFGQDMTILDLANNINPRAVEFLKTRKALLEKNVASRNEPIQRIYRTEMFKTTAKEKSSRGFLKFF